MANIRIDTYRLPGVSWASQARACTRARRAIYAAPPIAQPEHKETDTSLLSSLERPCSGLQASASGRPVVPRGSPPRRSR